MAKIYLVILSRYTSNFTRIIYGNGLYLMKGKGGLKEPSFFLA